MGEYQVAADNAPFYHNIERYLTITKSPVLARSECTYAITEDGIIAFPALATTSTS